MTRGTYQRIALLFFCVLCVAVAHTCAVVRAQEQEPPTPAPSPTTPPFVPSPTPGDPVDAFDSVFARFEASTLNPLTGEPFTLTLAVTLPEGTFVADWPPISGTWGAFEIRTVGDITETGREVRQDFTAVLWRPEDVRTPETFIGYSAGGGDMRRVPVRELIFSVPTVLEPDADTLQPPLPPDTVSWPLPILVVVGGIVLALGITVWAQRPALDDITPPTPAQTALSKLRGLTKRPADMQLQAALAVLRELNLQTPHDALVSAISTGEALAYTGAPVRPDDAALFVEFAIRAVRESARE